MAALPDRFADPLRQHLSLVDLRDFSEEHLQPLLDEETESWRTGLDWDFHPSADLVRRFVHLRALNGYVLMSGATVAGYSYYLAEEGKGLIGDFYVRSAFRTLATESQLLDAVLDAMWKTPGMRRIETQLMMIGSPLDRPVPYTRWFRSYPRRFLEATLPVMPPIPSHEPPGVQFLPWAEKRQDDAAKLLAMSYRGHIDSQINDQYRSPAGARRFLNNIVQYPGCGAFFGSASFIAWDRVNHNMCGVSLASLVAAQTGHITQICVAPSHQGRGIGCELLRRSLTALAAHGCNNASLTVTAANESALRLYARVGFRNRRDFAAYVWEPR
jgi:ribosomal protein S18 acetylase RimI-like enzyme